MIKNKHKNYKGILQQNGFVENRSGELLEYTFDGNSRGYLRLRQEIVGVVPSRIAVIKNPGTPSEYLGVNFPTLVKTIILSSSRRK